MNLRQIVSKSTPVLAFLFGIYYFCIRLLGTNFQFIPGDLGDSRFINYLLEHGYRWLTGEIPSFWDAGFMYPFKNTIALSDSMLGTMPFYAVWRIAGFSPETSYQLWWLIICTLNYWISYLIFKKWFNRSDIAVVLAWIFAFTIYNLGQLNYMQMIIRFVIPIVFYAAYRMISNPSVKYFSIYSLGIVYQFYCGMYTGFYLFYFSILFIIIYLFFTRNWKMIVFYFRRGNIIYTAAIISISLLTILWLFIPYFRISRIVGLLHYDEVLPNIPYWRSYLLPHISTVTWKFLIGFARPDVPVWWLHFLFVGIIPFVIIIVSPFCLIYGWYKKLEVPVLIKALLIASILILIFHVKTGGGHSLYILLFKLPGFSSIRVITRFMNVELIILLIILGYFLTKLHARYTFILMFLMVADNLFKPGLVPREEKVKLIHRKELLMSEIKKFDFKKYKAIAYYNDNEPSFVSNLDMMLAAQSLGLNTINGYSSYCPAGLTKFTKLNVEEGLYSWIQKQNIDKDSVLVIRKVSENYQNNKIDEIMDHIRKDPKWMESITKKAQEKSISVDSMLFLDAIWLINNESQ